MKLADKLSMAVSLNSALSCLESAKYLRVKLSFFKSTIAHLSNLNGYFYENKLGTNF